MIAKLILFKESNNTITKMRANNFHLLKTVVRMINKKVYTITCFIIYRVNKSRVK